MCRKTAEIKNTVWPCCTHWHMSMFVWDLHPLLQLKMCCKLIDFVNIKYSCFECSNFLVINCWLLHWVPVCICTFFTFKTKKNCRQHSISNYSLLTVKIVEVKCLKKLRDQQPEFPARGRNCYPWLLGWGAAWRSGCPRHLVMKKTNVKYTALYHSLCRLAHRSKELIGCCLETGFKGMLKEQYVSRTWAQAGHFCDGRHDKAWTDADETKAAFWKVIVTAKTPMTIRVWLKIICKTMFNFRFGGGSYILKHPPWPTKHVEETYLYCNVVIC